jgi:hypothetical protein
MRKLIFVTAVCCCISSGVFAEEAKLTSPENKVSSVKVEPGAVAAGKLSLYLPGAEVKVTSRGRLFKSPSITAQKLGNLYVGDEVTIVETRGEWFKVKVIWDLKPKKYVYGFIEKAVLPPAPKPAANEGPEKSQPISAGTTTLTPAVASEPLKKQITVDIISAKPAESTGLAERIKVLVAENKQLKEDLAKRQAEIKSMQAVLATSLAKEKAAEHERQKLANELRAAKDIVTPKESQSEPSRDAQFVQVADKGEAVYINGIGEAAIAATGGKSVIRFPLTDSERADAVLMQAGAEKIAKGSFVYYVVDSSVLKF